MILLAQVSLYLVVLLHLIFALIESVLWCTPAVSRSFGNSVEQAQQTRILALNQGAYNAGISSLLFFFQWNDDLRAVQAVLCFIIVMGLIGGFSASKSIIALQSIPALIALVLISMF